MLTTRPFNEDSNPSIRPAVRGRPSATDRNLAGLADLPSLRHHDYLAGIDAKGQRMASRSHPLFDSRGDQASIVSRLAYSVTPSLSSNQDAGDWSLLPYIHTY